MWAAETGERTLKEHKYISQMTLYFENLMMFELSRNISLMII